MTSVDGISSNKEYNNSLNSRPGEKYLLYIVIQIAMIGKAIPVKVGEWGGGGGAICVYLLFSEKHFFIRQSQSLRKKEKYLEVN
jgi:hypothetical protein